MRYFSGRDPWEYELSDVSVLCGFCHEEIHDAEDAMREVVRSCPPWVAREWKHLAETISELGMSHSGIASLAARARSIARQINTIEQ